MRMSAISPSHLEKNIGISGRILFFYRPPKICKTRDLKLMM